jgi:hypothetical protein
VLHGLASWQERRTAQAWAQSLGPLDDLPSRFPRASISPAGQKVQDLARKLGIDLAAGGATQASAGVEDAQAFQELRRELVDYVDGTARLGNDQAAAPPEQVTAFLAAHAGTLDELIQTLRAGQPVSWEQDVEKTLSAPVPPVLGIRSLHTLLLAQGLARSHAGLADEAFPAFDAAWVLQSSLDRRPDLISQMLATVLDELLSGALRQAGPLPAPWPERLLAVDHRPRVFDAFRTEAWVLGAYARQAGASIHLASGSGGGSLFDRLGEVTFGSPFLRLCGADQAETLRRALLRMKDQDACTPPDAAFDGSVKPAGWNIVGKIAVPSFARAFGAAASADLAAEFTARLAQQRAARGPEGAWPAALASVASTRCPQVKYTWQVAPDGTATLAAQAPGVASKTPLRFEAHARP